MTPRLRSGQAENRATLAFVAVALVLALAAWATAPRVDTPASLLDRGDAFFPGFTDPASAASLEVLEFNDTTFSRSR